ncbi:MAG: ammonium transporter [Polyangiales bacterium]
MRLRAKGAATAALVFFSPLVALADDGSAVDSGDNAFLLVSTGLVLMMTGPGLALFYGGLVRSKNVLATMMQSFVMMSLVSILWALYGYGMAFGEGNALVGSPSAFLLLRGVGAEPNATYAATIPHLTFALYQMMFAIITPALISGAVAERMKFTSYLLFTTLWATVVYFPLAHMVWGQGGYFNWALGGRVPVLDFAGGTVVHISSGVSALVAAIVLGKRQGWPGKPMIPHNVVLSLIGTGLLWFGWFGFNGGSALNAGGLATTAIAATHFAGAAGGVSWTLVEWSIQKKPSVLGTASGMVAGLATITPASGFVTPGAAILIGLAGGAICYLAVSKLKARFRYDDTLDAFGVHGIGSTIGMLMLGLLASSEANPAIAATFTRGGQPVSLEGGLAQLGNQAIGTVFTAVYAALGTVVILKVASVVTGGLRVDEDEEDQGLDVSQHGEEAYNS